MKKKAVYSESGVVYWPSYQAGRCMQVLLVLFLLLSVALCVGVFFGNSTTETGCITIVLSALVVVGSILMFRVTLKSMNVRIEISDRNVKYDNFYTKKKIEFNWDEVSEVVFKKQPWRPITRLIITVKDRKEKVYLFISDVDEKKVLDLIPKHLCKIKPQL